MKPIFIKRLWYIFERKQSNVIEQRKGFLELYPKDPNSGDRRSVT